MRSQIAPWTISSSPAAVELLQVGGQRREGIRLVPDAAHGDPHLMPISFFWTPPKLSQLLFHSLKPLGQLAHLLLSALKLFRQPPECFLQTALLLRPLSQGLLQPGLLHVADAAAPPPPAACACDSRCSACSISCFCLGCRRCGLLQLASRFRQFLQRLLDFLLPLGELAQRFLDHPLLLGQVAQGLLHLGLGVRNAPDRLFDLPLLLRQLAQRFLHLTQASVSSRSLGVRAALGTRCRPARRGAVAAGPGTGTSGSGTTCCSSLSARVTMRSSSASSRSCSSEGAARSPPAASDEKRRALGGKEPAHPVQAA